MKYTFLSVSLLSLLLLACKPKITPEQQPLEDALSAYAAAPSDSTAHALSAAVNAYIVLKGTQDSTAARYVIAAARAESSQDNLDEALGHYRTWLTAYPARPDMADKAAEVIAVATPKASPMVQQAMYRAFTNKYPNDSRTTDWKTKILDPDADLDSLLRVMKANMFNTETFRLDEAKANEYILAVELSVMLDPALPSGPENLHLAAESARTIRNPEKAIELFDWLVAQYPQHPRGITALFLKGFVIDNDLKDYTRAGEVYNEFLAKHPTHEFAESAKFMLQNLGKSDEELIKMLEEKNKGKEVQ
jgi:tetratricopeptide (TPR) repeat protein